MIRLIVQGITKHGCKIQRDGDETKADTCKSEATNQSLIRFEASGTINPVQKKKMAREIIDSRRKLLHHLAKLKWH